MQTRYLLPCRCGKKIEVDAHQSGLVVRCACGAEQPVPTLRGLAGLERTEAASLPSAPAASGWGPRQGLVFLGLVVIALSLLSWFALRLNLPDPVTPKENYRELDRDYIGELSPAALIAEWDNYRKGIADPEWAVGMDNYLAHENDYHKSLYIVGAAAAVGIILVVIGLCLRPAPQAGVPRR